METKKKKLQLKKETIAVLNDPEMNNIRGAGAPGEAGVPGVPGASGGIGCNSGPLDTNCGLKTKIDKSVCVCGSGFLSCA